MHFTARSDAARPRTLRPALGFRLSLPILAAIALGPLQDAVASDLAGDVAAVARADEMVERVGGREIWAQLASLHLEQRFHIMTRRESVVHEEWIDFRTPRLYVSMRNELTTRLRAYDASGGWFLRDGEFTPFTEQQLVMERGFWKRDMFRMFHLIAVRDPTIELRMRGEHRLEVYERGGNELLCWFRLNLRSEPVLWGASVGDESLEFIFGPLAQYGNIRVPKWGGFTDGSWRFDMLDAHGSNHAPQVTYDPPAASEAATQ